MAGLNFEGPINDFKNYWLPKDGGQWAVAASSLVAGPAPWAAVAVGNAIEAGMQADDAPERARARAEDEVWH